VYPTVRIEERDTAQ